MRQLAIRGYEDIMNPANPALDLAAMIGRSETAWSRNTWKKRLKAIGDQRFRLELYYFWNDIRQGATPRSCAATLTSRLDAILKREVV